ncbi:hypothetical protein CHARACLAT_014413 [Characodon lateralis]|uniref:Uncharacterized protein n=1 Tax=Characodon lateralis TaxID=208331 RepID=A0ABU7D6P7_9TELE|nr:hypothetical protein [Characodon lateralis]
MEDGARRTAAEETVNQEDLGLFFSSMENLGHSCDSLVLLERQVLQYFKIGWSSPANNSAWTWIILSFYVNALTLKQLPV